MTMIIEKMKKHYKSVLAFLLITVMLIGIVPLTATEVAAQTIPIGTVDTNPSFGTGGEWEDGDKIRLLRKTDQFVDYYLTAEVAEDGTVTWTPDKKVVWDGKGEHTLFMSYPNMELTCDNFHIPTDQSDLQKLKEADCMNAIWTGIPTNEDIDFTLKHRLSMVTVTYTLASEFEPDTVITPEVYSNTQYMFFDVNTLERRDVAWQEGYDIWVTPYQHEGKNGAKQFTAIVSPDAYSAGDDFIRITVGDQVLTAKMQEDITFAEGTHYTFNLKVGKDKVTVEQVSMNDIDSPFGEGWNNEEDLK